MRRSIPALILVASAALLLISAPADRAFGQADPAKPRPPGLPAQPSPPPNWSKPINVDFSGGTGVAYVESLRKAAPDGNIVVLGDLDQISMPAVRLRNVDVYSALKVLDSLPRQQGDRGFDIHIDAIQQEQDPVFTVTATVRRINEKPRSSTPQTMIWSLADLLGAHLKPAEALSAIETALGLIKGDAEPAQIKFHEETGLLISRGTPEQVETIRGVLVQLREREGTLGAREERARAERQAAENAAGNGPEIMKLRDRVAHLEAERDALAARVKDLESKNKPQ